MIAGIQDLIAEAQLFCLYSVHPGLTVHEVRELGPAEAGLDLIGVDD